MSSEARTQMVQAPDGRELEVVSAGPEDGRCFLFHSGTPSAAAAYPPLVAQLAKRGLRLVTFSRPGYAGSSPMPGRGVGDVAIDVQAVLDTLKIGSFFCAGSPAAVHTRWPARHCCRIASSPQRHSPGSHHGAPMGWTGSAAWALKTSRSSAPP